MESFEIDEEGRDCLQIGSQDRRPTLEVVGASYLARITKRCHPRFCYILAIPRVDLVLRYFYCIYAPS